LNIARRARRQRPPRDLSLRHRSVANCGQVRRSHPTPNRYLIGFRHSQGMRFIGNLQHTVDAIQGLNVLPIVCALSDTRNSFPKSVFAADQIRCQPKGVRHSFGHLQRDSNLNFRSQSSAGPEHPPSKVIDMGANLCCGAQHSRSANDVVGMVVALKPCHRHSHHRCRRSRRSEAFGLQGS
jgi:hypothetical protein